MIRIRRSICRRWCARGDLNSHPFRDQILSLARLPFRHARHRRKKMPFVVRSSSIVLVLPQSNEGQTLHHRYDRDRIGVHARRYK